MTVESAAGAGVVDCHVHVFDPARFPYASDTPYAPAGQELGTPARLAQLLDWHGVRHAVLVGPNSGYGEDNRCLLDTLATAEGRYRGMAVVSEDISRAELATLKAAGVVGVTLNAAQLGLDHYAGVGPMLAHLAALGMIADVQVVDDQLVALAPLLERSGVRVHIDHCGRPDPGAGIDAAGFRELLRWGEAGRAVVKLSGCVKVSREPYPPRRPAALRPRAGGDLRAGPLRVGLGLALPAHARTRRLRTAAGVAGPTGARRARPPPDPVGHPVPGVRIRPR